MKVLAYLIYGEQQEYQLELALSILSALQFLKKSQESITISVITDRPHLSFDLPVDRILISPTEFAEWTQEGTYNYRAKILGLRRAIDHYQAPVALVDTDTYFRQSPGRLFDRISSQTSVMHDFEYEIGNQSYWQPIVEQIGDGIEIEGVWVSAKSPMFNSGVIGVDVNHRTLLDKALIVMDKVYALSPIFNVEQFALGVVLNQYTHLSTCTDLVWHYWGIERDFIHVQTARLLQDFTTARLESILKDVAVLPLGSPSKPVLDKTISRLLGFIKRWDDDYRFAHLSYRCALTYAGKDRAYANAWAKMALHGVKKSIAGATTALNKVHPASSIQHDFRRLKPSHIDRLNWLEPAVKQKWLEFWQAL